MYKMIYTRKRLLRSLFSFKQDVFEIWGPKTHYFPDPTHGNGGTSETREVFSKLETFVDLEEAQRVLDNLRTIND